MSQNDFTIANQGFPAFRADLNSALQALASNSSGATAPSTTFANMWWYDSANNIMYIRNEDNDAWIKFAELDQTNDKFVLSGTLQLDDGTVSAPALTFNSDTNMGIYRGGTDILKFVTAGTDAITIDADQDVILGNKLSLKASLTNPITFENQHSVTTDASISTFDDANGTLIALGSNYYFDSSGNEQRFNTGEESSAVLLNRTGTVQLKTNGTGATAVDRLKVDSNGDISFYEDTGTTPKLFWDASNEALGIGLTNPATALHVKGGSNENVMVVDATGTSPNYIFDVRDDGTSKFRIDGSGRVSIGHTSTGGSNFAICDGANSAIQFFAEISTDTNLIQNYDPTATAYMNSEHRANSHIFKIGTSNAVKIDSSSNLLVGTTNSSPTVNNVEGGGIISGGQVQGSKDSSSAASFNRKGTDGSIINIRKDGSTVGSIGTFGSALYISSPDGTDAGLRVGNSTVLPVTTTGALRDNAINLGSASARWKDLYLSGGVYLGGTGSANKIDDYEEGTWNPSAGAGLSVTGTFTSEGMYRKVGNIVTIQGTMRATSLSCSASSLIAGNLPFTASNTTDSYGGGTLFNNGGLEGGVNFIAPNSTNLYSSRAMTSTTTIFFNAVYSTT